MSETIPFTIREVDSKKDIQQVPDLIEMCFHRWLDADGIRVINEMRTTAGRMKAYPLLSALSPTSYPMAGVVCQTQDGRIVGNISIFNTYINDIYSNVFANVCVHPDFRGRGIARQMMERSIDLSRRDGADKVYLQARMETQHVITMYRALGFQETHRRTSWIHPKSSEDDTTPIPLHVCRTRFRERKLFESCFSRNYPDSVLWNINYPPSLFRSGILFDGIRKLQIPHDDFFRMADVSGSTLGWFARQRMKAFADAVWFIPLPDSTEAQITDMLRLAASRYQLKRPILINLPEGEYEDELKSAGYFVHNRLIWMKKNL